MSRIHSLKSHSEASGPTAEEVRSYLRELLGRDQFNASERNRRFLSYVVQETLEGRAERIKAYNIALAAFDRMEDFDPLTDPIVRIEAGRLRRSLEHYYLTAGRTDRIQIEIPKGSYAATFTYQEEASGASEPRPVLAAGSLSPLRQPPRFTPGWIRIAAVMAGIGMIAGSLGAYVLAKHALLTAPSVTASGEPSLVIFPFEEIGGDPDRAFVARGLTYDVGTALTQLKNVAVFGPGEVGDEKAPSPRHGGDMALMGSVQTDRHSMRVVVFLVDSRTGRFLQSWAFRKELIVDELIRTQSEVAQQIVASLREQCTRDTAGDRSAGRRAFDCRPVPIAAK